MASDAFNIVFIEPPQFRFPGIFNDLAGLLKLSLESLGYSVETNRNRLSPRRINLLLGYHMMSEPVFRLLRGVRWIPYQLEQLKLDEKTPGFDYCLDILAQANEVWDLDLGNIAYLRSKGIEAVRHVPIGFHPSMRTIVPAANPDIDVLHYGVLGKRRSDILTSLSQKCQLRVGSGFGADRDRLISRSKIVLNLHRYDGGLLEQVRISHLLNNGVCVVSEDAHHNPYADILPTVPYDQLIDRCLQLLADDEARRQLAEDSAQRFSRMPMTEILSKLLKDPAQVPESTAVTRGEN
jgi:hypothetical protein